ncbi:GNAT family N-acetyltransferase [Lysinibacillus piscis]|uniref:N-acetyltransferase n=1 Tax=Lysinibacillus piscis TaxID=2518931 RepID=A0ABQ5NPF6_9BACI|nr:GNAT family N-acetyltransferase [Lysinibacillus sp. KH24]GLC90251.1 N-acetyltransferase [Lysinibacillus sp. KH24]
MIRFMTEQDVAGVLDIYNDVILTSKAVYRYEIQTLEEKIQWFQDQQAAGNPLLVFEEDGIVAGFATYGQFRPYPGYKYTMEHSVYVHKEHYQKGIATKLMHELIRIAEERGVKTLVAGIDGENSVSIKAHEKLGFEYAGTIKQAGYKFGEWLDLVFYQLQLKGPQL